jgi:hypothetical protein
MEADKSWLNVRALELSLQMSAQNYSYGVTETDEKVLERAKKLKEFMSG